MKHYLRTLIRLISDLTVYREILMYKLRHSLKHYLTSYLILVALVSWYLNQFIIPQFIDQAYDNLLSLTNHYPDTLVLHVTPEGMTISGSQSPVSIPLATTTQNSTGLKYLATVDLSAYAESINQHESLILLTSKALAARSGIPDAGDAIVTWQELGLTTEITKDRVINEAADLRQLLGAFEILSFPTIFLTLLITTTIARLISALLYALVLSSLGPLFRKPYPYRAYLNLCLYLTPMTETVCLVQFLVYRNSYAQYFQLIFFGLCVIAVTSLPKAIRVRV